MKAPPALIVCLILNLVSPLQGLLRSHFSHVSLAKIKFSSSGAFTAVRQREWKAKNFDEVYCTPFNDSDDSDDSDESEDDESDVPSRASSTLITQAPTPSHDGALRIALISTDDQTIEPLLQSLNISLRVETPHIFSTKVVDPLDLIIASRYLALSKRFDVIVCLAYLQPDEIFSSQIYQTVATQLSQIAVDSLLPIAFPAIRSTTMGSDLSQQSSRLVKQILDLGQMRLSALGIHAKEPMDSLLSHFPNLVATEKRLSSRPAKRPARLGF